MWADELIVKQIQPETEEYEISLENDVYGPVKLYYFTGRLYNTMCVFFNVHTTKKIFKISYEEIYKHFGNVDNPVIIAMTEFLNMFFNDVKKWSSIEDTSTLEEWEVKYVENFKQFLKNDK